MSDEELNETEETETETQAADEQVTVGDPQPEVAQPKAKDEVPEELAQYDFDEPEDDPVPSKADPEAEKPAEKEDDGKQGKEADAAPPAPALSDEDKARAKKFGFTDSEIASIQSPEQLDYVVGLVHRVAAQQRQAGADAGKQDTAEPPTPEAKQPGAGANASPLKFDIKFDDVVDERVVAGVNALAQQVSEQVAAQLATLQRAQAQIVDTLRPIITSFNEHMTEMQETHFDNFVASLGDEWSDVFGTGSLSDLDPKSTEYANRIRLHQAARTLNLGRSQTGANPYRIRQAWKRAVPIEFGDKATTKAAEKTKQQIRSGLEKSAGRMLSRPNGTRNTVKDSELSKALARIGRGSAPEPSEDDEP
jgi:hypothetical protein